MIMLQLKLQPLEVAEGNSAGQTTHTTVSTYGYKTLPGNTDTNTDLI